MHIKPFDRTMKEILEAGFYRIPRFQRPYSWDSEQVDDLWSDAIANDDPDYFIGSFVLYRANNQTDTFNVVDGQQRLTTITLLLAAIRNGFESLGRKSLATGIQKLIERENIDNERRYVLQTETSYPYLQEYIQKFGSPDLPASTGAEEEALKLAFDHLKTKIADTIASVTDDPMVSDAKKPAEQQRRLTKVRDNALRLQLIVVELTNEDDAYLIFETLNTRGKDLGISDLVKNHLTRLIKPPNKGVDAAKDKWNKIMGLFDASAVEVGVNSFIYHAWLSRYPYVGKEKLFKVIKQRISKPAAMAYLDDLVGDADLYRQLLEPKSYKWTKQEVHLSASLDALNVFRVVQPLPMTLAILREFRSGGLTMTQTRKILRDMENFHVQFTAVTAQRTGGGTARMYAASAEELAKASNKNQRAHVLTSFRQKMRERVPLKGEFIANFSEIEYRADSTKQKALVQYLLRRIHEHTWSGAPIDYSMMTIEHIAPQNPQGSDALDYVGKIGNLVLLPQDQNDAVANLPFEAKRKAYIDKGVVLDEFLAKAKKWGNSEIEKRTQILADLAYDKIFKV